MWKLDSYTCIQICFTKDALNEEEIAFIFPLLCGLRHGQMMYFKKYFALAERVMFSIFQTQENLNLCNPCQNFIKT